MTKNKKGPEFSEERETRVLLEDLNSQFRFFGEDLKDVRNRLERIEDKVDHLEIDVSQLKIEMSFVRKVLPTVATKDDLKQMEKRLTALEASR